MGRVYRAEQKALGRTVAVKIIHPHLLGDESASVRFITEARAASRLNHPNSVGVIDFGKNGGQLLPGHGVPARAGTSRASSTRRARSCSAASSTSSVRCSRRSPRRTTSASSTAISSPRTSCSSRCARRRLREGRRLRPRQAEGRGRRRRTSRAPASSAGPPTTWPRAGREAIRSTRAQRPLRVRRHPVPAAHRPAPVRGGIADAGGADAPLPCRRPIRAWSRRSATIPEPLVEVTLRRRSRRTPRGGTSRRTSSRGAARGARRSTPPRGASRSPTRRSSAARAGPSCRAARSSAASAAPGSRRRTRPPLRRARAQRRPARSRPRPRAPAPVRGARGRPRVARHLPCRRRGTLAGRRGIVGEHGVGRSGSCASLPSTSPRARHRHPDRPRPVGRRGRLLRPAGRQAGLASSSPGRRQRVELERRHAEAAARAARDLRQGASARVERRRHAGTSRRGALSPTRSPLHRRGGALRWAARAQQTASRTGSCSRSTTCTPSTASRNAFADVIAEPLLAALAHRRQPHPPASSLEWGAVPRSAASRRTSRPLPPQQRGRPRAARKTPREHGRPRHARRDPSTAPPITPRWACRRARRLQPSSAARAATVPPLYIDQLVRYTHRGGSDLARAAWPTSSPRGSSGSCRRRAARPGARRHRRRGGPRHACSACCPDIRAFDDLLGKLAAAGIDRGAPRAGIRTAHPLFRDVTLATIPAGGPARSRYAKAPFDSAGRPRSLLLLEVQARSTPTTRRTRSRHADAARAGRRPDACCARGPAPPACSCRLRRGLDLERREIFRGEPRRSGARGPGLQPEARRGPGARRRSHRR